MPDDVAGSGAERDPDADLTGPLRHGEGEDAVDAEGGQEQSHGGKRRDESRLEQWLGGRFSHQVAHRRDRTYRLLRIGLPDDLPQERAGDELRIDRRASYEDDAVARRPTIRLRERPVDGASGRLRRTVLVHIVDYAYNGQPFRSAGSASHREAPPDRVGAVPDLASDGIADDRNARRAGIVARREVPAAK